MPRKKQQTPPVEAATRYAMIKGCERCEQLETETEALKEAIAKQKEEISGLKTKLKEADEETETMAEEVRALQKAVTPGEFHKVDLTILHPYQRDPISARCLVCLGSLFYREKDATVRRSTTDIRVCRGRHWLWRRSCPEGPHLHRYCAICHARWFEAKTEDGLVRWGK